MSETVVGRVALTEALALTAETSAELLDLVEELMELANDIAEDDLAERLIHLASQVRSSALHVRTASRKAIP